jgi:pimeloyl-ACP methyl ester carboxylesterase
MARFEVTVDGAVLAGERVGEGGPAAALLHAGVADRRAWASLTGALSASRTVVSYDRRGFGETTTTPTRGASRASSSSRRGSAGCRRAS